MAAGPGYTEPETGIYKMGEADEAPGNMFSELINKITDSMTTFFVTVREEARAAAADARAAAEAAQGIGMGNDSLNASLINTNGSATDTALKGRFGALSAINRWTGKNLFGQGIAAPRPRQPFASSQVMRATDPGTHDHVGHLFETRLVGSFADDTGPNARKIFGYNAFTVTGQEVGDGDGIEILYGGLSEADVAAPDGTTIVLVIGHQAEASFFGAESGAHVEQMRSQNVAAPVRKDGATGGTAKRAIALHVEEAKKLQDDGDAFSVWIAGGDSRINGRAVFAAKDITDIPVTIVAKAGQTAPLFLINDGNGSRVVRVNAADNSMTVAGPIVARENTSSQVKAGAFGPAAEPAVALGNVTPAVLYRDATGRLHSAQEIRSDVALSTSGKVYAEGLRDVTVSTGAPRGIEWGNGSPEGVVAMKQGSMFLRIDAAAGPRQYVKETGGEGNTGWVAK